MKGWYKESARHSLASRGLHSVPHKHHMTIETLDTESYTKLREMCSYLESISSMRDGEKVVILYRGTDIRESKEAKLYADRGWPYTAYGRWWSTNEEEAMHYATSMPHYDESGKWCMLTMEVPLSELLGGKLYPKKTHYLKDVSTFTAEYHQIDKYDNIKSKVYFEKKKDHHYPGYIICFTGGRPIDANRIRTVLTGEYEK